MHPATGPVPPSSDVEPHTDAAGAGDSGAVLIEEELLIEEISIDGMCGVY